jgi:hypothetical protein
MYLAARDKSPELASLRVTSSSLFRGAEKRDKDYAFRGGSHTGGELRDCALTD